MDIIVGSTGFVGSNLIAQHSFDGLYHSTDISNAYGLNPDLLVYAGVRAEMFLANRDPEADRRLIDGAIENIQKIAPAECVLISTIAVYPDTHGADEDTEIREADLSAYGANRLYLERWVEQNIENCLIVRLPAIFGKNLKKNFLYDYIHVIPALLTEKKLEELLPDAPQLREYYVPQNNGFYRCKSLDSQERAELKKLFLKLGFSALNFTDSRSVYQFYALRHLWKHIETARANHLRRLNITTPPVSVSEVYHHLSGKDFTNLLSKPPFSYDLRSKYSALFGGESGYLITREQELEDIRAFVCAEMEEDK